MVLWPVASSALSRAGGKEMGGGKAAAFSFFSVTRDAKVDCKIPFLIGLQ